MNVALITLDSVRYDVFTEASTPWMDGLGKVFESRAHADTTFPSHMALLSGNLHVPMHLSAKTSVAGPWMPSVLKKAGYNTIMAASLPWIRKEMFDAGFNRFFSIPFNKEDAMVPLSQLLGAVEPALKKEDNFLVLNVGETHWPYTRTMRHPARTLELCRDMVERPMSLDPKMGESMRADQAKTLSWVDGVLELFFRKGDWLIYITADHGEEFGENGRWLHGHGCYPNEVSVPVLCSNWSALLKLVEPE